MPPNASEDDGPRIYIVRLSEPAEAEIDAAYLHLMGRNTIIAFDQYHEPPDELSQETRTFARMIASLMEEAETINWYEQRISVD